MAEGKEKPLTLQHQRERIKRGKEPYMNYNTKNSGSARKALIILLAAVIFAGIAYVVALNANAEAAENRLATVWVMCKPGTQVNVRRRPMTDSKSETQLDAGMEVLTDGESQDGWIRVYGVGENGGGWIYHGYIVLEEPQKIGTRYVCVAKKQAACRRWMGGPQVERHKWIKNGENVDVFFIADGWACTSLGYIQSEWLEPDPE